MRHPLREIGLAAAFFLVWRLFVVTLKRRILEDCRIEVPLLSTAAIGAGLLVLEVATEVDRELGEGGLRRLFFMRPARPVA